MCGVAGFASAHPLDQDAAARAARMRDVLVHRGPDEAGLYIDEHAALGHRRLSIVDLGSGQQPLANEDRSIWVAYNGEIYNHAEVRRELESRGHRYRTRSDTETIVHAYEEWGDDCVHRFRGMFAFALWDAPRRRLLLARDRLGVKPLYWARVGDTLFFGSEIKALLSSGAIEPEADVDALPELLATRYLSGPDTLFRNIHRLEPAQRLVFEQGRVATTIYWDVPTPVEGSGGRAPRDIRQAAGEFRERLTEAVRLRLMSDVPLGMFLSGGIDSSAIAALMARQIDRPLQTFSVAFKDRAFNELGYARDVARAIGADAHEIVIDAAEFFEALPRLVWHEDEPIAHPSSVPLYFVSVLARRHVTVVLTGEGSDELLAGYGKYPRTAWNWRLGSIYRRLAPSGIRAALGATAVRRLPPRAARLAARSFLAVDRTPEAMVFDNFAAIRVGDQQRLLAPGLRDLATHARIYAASRRAFDAPPAGSTLLQRLLNADLKTYLVELLMKQDQMSMAASIESRVPFLDHPLVEFASLLPDRLKLSGWQTKRILREAMHGVLPDSILNRPKMGFPVPFGRWLRSGGGWQEAVRGVLLDRRARERGIFDPAAVEAMLDDHAAGRSDAADQIWSALNVELWHRTFIDRLGVQRLDVPAVRPVEAA